MWARATAGLLPGFFLAAAITGLIAWSAPGPWQHAVVPGIVVFAPAWIVIAGCAFLFRSGRLAWIVFTVAAATGFGLLGALKAFGVVS